MYIDELIEVSVNKEPIDDPLFDPADPDHDADDYYATHEANFNITALFDDTGGLVERYHYTPYGERSVYVPEDGSDDYGTMYVGYSQAVEIPGAPGTYQPYSINDHGHQGLCHDQPFGLIYNRARTLHPGLGRFLQRDSAGYVDGMSLYAALLANPIVNQDPSGTIAKKQLIESMEREKRSHGGTMYGGVFKIDSFYDPLIQFAANIRFKEDEAKKGEDKGGHYDPVDNAITLVKGKWNSTTIMHEVIHAYDASNGWNFTIGKEPTVRTIAHAETLAYAYEEMLGQLGQFKQALARFEKEAVFRHGKAKPSKEEIVMRWDAFWAVMAKLPRKNARYVDYEGEEQGFPIGYKAFELFEKHFAPFDVSCAKLAPVYEKLLRSKGIDCKLNCHYKHWKRKTSTGVVNEIPIPVVFR